MRRTLELPSFGTSNTLRRELSARNVLRAPLHAHELSSGAVPAVVYHEDEAGNHGNFYPAAYRQMLRNPQWRERLTKAYTGSHRVPHSHVRTRHELDTACSSDALLMSIFCAPRTLRSKSLRALLGLGEAARVDFGVRTRVPLVDGHDDRTEADMQIAWEEGRMLFEAKLTESGFPGARPALLYRYPNFEEVFDTARLPRNGRGDCLAYQLLRNVLAADALACRFALLADARRPDLHEQAFRVFAAVRSADLRSRLHLFTWQEIAACVTRPLQHFLADKYGVLAWAPHQSGPRGARKLDDDDSYT